MFTLVRLIFSWFWRFQSSLCFTDELLDIINSIHIRNTLNKGVLLTNKVLEHCILCSTNSIHDFL